MVNFYYDLEDSLDDVKFNCFIIDPKVAYRESRLSGFKETLLNGEEIKALGQMALKVYTEYAQSQLEPQGVLERADKIEMKELVKKVLENHKLKGTLPVYGEHTQLQAIMPRRQFKIMKNEKERQLKELKLAQESLRLRNSEKLSCPQIMDRLGISYYKLRRYLNNPIKKAQFWNLKQGNRGKYKKLHSRARTHIVNMLTYDQVPLQISDIQKSLQQKVQLHRNKQMIRRFLKNELMMTYKQVKQITNLHINNSSKLQRQYAAQQFVLFLNEGKRIINIDESVLHQTDERRKGWTAPYVKS
ncbi:hypothetical protein OXYTRIMIC_744 [Oxytricha trifallax]|uniref:Uncharacterized protein n=1 Tax=Oxytricha trifallax TaxID=1172189 RepID=A0A073IBA9_9SPIT|nr:hypothetical protein OXYTRIMIC_744 [Oxytricha trifallax]